MSENTRLIPEVRDALARDPRIHNPSELAVAQRGSAVTLRGTVRSPHQRHVALTVAGAVRGVRSVADELVIDPRDHYDDDQLRGAALQALIDAENVPDDRIDVTVASAWLTLKGTVKEQEDSNAAFAATSNLPGLGGITNEIRVVTAGA